MKKNNKMLCSFRTTFTTSALALALSAAISSQGHAA